MLTVFSFHTIQIKPSQLSSHVPQKPQYSLLESLVRWWSLSISAHYSVTTQKNGCHLQKWCRKFSNLINLNLIYFFMQHWYTIQQSIQLNSIYSIYSNAKLFKQNGKNNVKPALIIFNWLKSAFFEGISFSFKNFFNWEELFACKNHLVFFCAADDLRWEVTRMRMRNSIFSS